MGRKRLPADQLKNMDYANNREAWIRRSAARQKLNWRERRIYLRAYHEGRRTAAIDRLGGRCVRCGFSDPRALQIDHVNGGGTRELRTINTSGVVSAVLNGANGGKYQLLCANCNWIKRHERGEKRGRIA